MTIISRIARIEARYFRRFERRVYRIVLATLREVAENPNAISRDSFEKMYIRIYQEIGVNAASLEFGEIRKREPIKLETPPNFFLPFWNQFMTNYVRENLATRITNVTDNTRKAVAQAIQEGEQAGELRNAIAKRVRAVIVDRARSLAIAKTETTLARNKGKELSADQWRTETGQNLMKVWIHSGADNEREDHVNAQGKPVPKDGVFLIGGTRMQYPGDPAGGASQVINCQCTHIYVSERYAERNF
jgi:hypothetical protein